MCDDAWALAYKFHPNLPPFALDVGADLAIGSVHKTLSGLSQTSVISIKGSRIDSDRLALSLETYETTSGSAVLLASIDASRRQMVEDGEALLGEAIRLARRLRAARVSSAWRRSSRPVPGPAELRTEQVMRPRDAFYAATEMVSLDDAPGRIPAEFVTPYPPGIPLFVPGERITREIVDYLKTASAEGIYAEGCADQSLSTLRVTA